MATGRDIEELRLEIHKVKADLLKWMLGALIAQTAVIVGLLQLP